MQKISGTTENWETRDLGADAAFTEVANPQHHADLKAALEPSPSGHQHVKLLLQRGLGDKHNLNRRQLPG